MTALIESTLMSLDGVVEDPMRWVPFDDAARALALDNLRGYDGFLLGRTTFELFRDAWSAVPGAPTSTPSTPPASTSCPTVCPTIRAGSRRFCVEARPRLPNANGTADRQVRHRRLTRLLLEHNLIDQFQFWIFPVRVGKGRRLFDSLDGPLPPLTLTGTRELASGVVILNYVVVRNLRMKHDSDHRCRRADRPGCHRRVRPPRHTGTRAVRSAGRAGGLSDLAGVEVVESDILRPRTIGRALHNVERALIISSADATLLEGAVHLRRGTFLPSEIGA